MVLGIFFWIGLCIAIIYVSARALSGSIGQRFPLGVGAGMLLVAVAIGLSALGLKMFFPGSDGPPPWLGAAILALAAAMPAVSFPVVFVAYRRTVDVPAAQEEAASRPLRVWLPAGIVSAIIVVIGLVAIAVTTSDPW